MTRASALVVVAAAAGSFVLSAPASAQSVSVRVPQAVVASAATAGNIHGVVIDTRGRPLAGAMVSALGTTVAFALTGKDGKFQLEALPIGPYTVRIHLDGFVPAPRQMVEVRATTPALVSVALRALNDAAGAGTTTRVLAAGILQSDGLPGASPASSTDPDHDHTESLWRIRHLTRSVLKDVNGAAGVDGGDPLNPVPDLSGRPRAARGADTTVQHASGLFDAIPFTGQINLVSIGSFNGLSDVWSANTLASSGVAYISIGAPVGRVGNLAVRGALSQGGSGSWFVAGSLTGRQASAHHFMSGITFSEQRYDQPGVLGIPTMSSGSRSVGVIHASDEWAFSPRVAIGFGGTYSWQDYMGGNGTMSPRVSFTVRPFNNWRVQTVAARYVLAPGSEEFLPGPAGSNSVILPAQRTFSPWSDAQGFRAQRTDLFEVGVERSVAAYVIGVRTFAQRVTDQSGAAFAVATAERFVPSLGHYYVASLGDTSARGWTLSVSRPLVSGVRGGIAYTQTTTRWNRATDPELLNFWIGTAPGAQNRLHDLTTSIDTEIRPTATHVYVLYKVNTGFARQDADRGGSGFDTRFDVQVNQALPFLNFTSADWEVLVAVCNLFRESTMERSVYDELLVVRPPKRVVGGLRVRF